MKERIRKTYKEKRKLMTKEEVERKSKRASEIFLSSSVYKNSKTLMLYMPLGNETDTSLIVQRALSDGKTLAFPITDKGTNRITPYFADRNTKFKQGAFSVNEPCDTKKADVSEIDTVLVPGIAFDKSGNRIGFGKGCYDEFLKNSKAIFVGFCYEMQICEKINSDSYDVRMDFLVTENTMSDLRH